jgi:acyl-CoA thioesterase-1
MDCLRFERLQAWQSPVVLALMVGMLLVGPGCDRSEEKGVEQAVKEPIDGLIVAMGDSLTAGLGVSLQSSYPALLEQRLKEEGLHFRVVNAGVSGETSSGARSRIKWILRLNPDLVILETGANDGLRGIAPELVEENISEIIKTLRAQGVEVVLAGMQMVANMGPDYLAQFNRIYPELAVRHQVTLVPFFLEGVAMQPGLNQADGIHPNEQGYRIIAENLLPYITQILEDRSKTRKVQNDK